MVFKSDKQRKAFFAKQGNTRSQIAPTMTKQKFILKVRKAFKRKKKPLFLFEVKGEFITIARGPRDISVPIKARTSDEAIRIARRRLNQPQFGREFFPFIKFPPRIIERVK